MRQKQRVFSLFLLSPSSRRAWIEILYRHRKDNINAVALLAEGVDRNCFLVSVPDRLKTSPSSRRAWIEMSCFAATSAKVLGRPPRGGRG